MSYKGKYTPKFPNKYKGDVRNIIWRSLWEYKVMKDFDFNVNILRWGSECCIIPYISPIDGSQHRYFVDFWVELREKDGKIYQKLIEVKPFAQTIAPKKKKRKTRKYINEVRTWGINQAKWYHAEQFSYNQGMEFLILTEKGIWKKDEFIPSRNRIF